MVLILFGVAVLLGSLTPFFVLPAFSLLMRNRYIVVEERMLEATFGASWLDYKARVRPWI